MRYETLFTTIFKAIRRPNGRKLRRMERTLERQITPVLEKQRKHILEKARSLFNEKQTNSQKIDIILEIVDETNDEIVDATMSNASRAMLLGASYRIQSLELAKIGISFNLGHPLAERYLEHDRRVLLESVLPQTTKDQIKPILLDALQTGQSYDATAEKISSAFSLSPERSQMIAVNEIGNAYEEGNMIPMRDLADQGNKVEKYWSTVQDDKVTPTHTQNEDDGWIGIDDTFSGTGDERAPASDNPNCRCTILWRFD